MPNFSYLYLHCNGMVIFCRTRVELRSLPDDGLYPYNLNEMSKNSYIHMGAECHNAPDEGAGVR